ncbi:MAG TPA: Rieske (2Fe-2S) protein [Dehalococcoidia bacterium]|nr:Rieske (2Fe-2S) protein [Dehalococcoidia bacterium]
MPEFVCVGKVDEFPAGVIRACRVGEKSVAVVRVSGSVHAYANACPHAGYTLSGGPVTETTLICDVHGAVFDLESGAALTGPASVGLVVYQVRLEGDDVLVAKA